MSLDELAASFNSASPVNSPCRILAHDESSCASHPSLKPIAAPTNYTLIIKVVLDENHRPVPEDRHTSVVGAWHGRSVSPSSHVPPAHGTPSITPIYTFLRLRSPTRETISAPIATALLELYYRHSHLDLHLQKLVHAPAALISLLSSCRINRRLLRNIWDALEG